MKPTPDTRPQPQIHVRLLGGFRAMRAEAPVSALDKGRTRALLAYLLLNRATPVSRQQLAYTLWPDTSDKQARANLRTLLTRLRRALADADQFLTVTQQTLQLRADAPLRADLCDFERFLNAANETIDGNERAQNLEQAVIIYRGDLLPDCYDEWIAPERERLRDAFLDALETLILQHEAQRTYGAAIAHAQRLLRTDPLHEATYRRLMRLHALNDNRAGGLRVYHACVDILQRELDVEPGTSTQAAYQRLLRRDATVATSPGIRRRQVQLVGRDQEWSRLIGAWRRASAGEPHMVAITGEAGMGKTRLAEEMIAWAERQGIVVGVAHCYALEDDLAYGPVSEWLREASIRQQWTTLDDIWLTEIARVVPDFLIARPALASPGSLNEQWQRQHMFEALARAILADSQPRLLFIDDLQWSSREMMDWLHYFLQFAPQAPALIVGAVRADEVMDDHRYAALRLMLQRRGQLSEIPLKPLNMSETTTLARSLSKHPLTSEEVETLHQDTEGNPLFIVEMIQASTGEGYSALHIGKRTITSPDATPQTQLLPEKVRSVLEYRLAQLSSPALAVLQLAAVIGRQFTFEILAAASDQSEDSLIMALDEVWQRRIVREQGINAYNFSHEKLRAVTYAMISPARRRLHHRRVAEALIQNYTGNLDAASGRIGRHFERAGLAAQAIRYYQRAAEMAQHLYANEDAIRHYQRGIALLEMSPSDSGNQAPDMPATAVQLHAGLGDVYALMGQHAEARAAYRRALAQIAAEDTLRRINQLRKIGDTQSVQHQHEKALANYHAAEELLTAKSTGVNPAWREARIQLQLSLMGRHYGEGDNEALAELIRTNRPMVEAYGTLIQRAEFLESVGLLGMRNDRYAVSDKTLEDQRVALQAWQATDDQGGIANNQFSLGFCHLWRRELDSAEHNFQDAFHLANEIGHGPVQTMCATYLAMLRRFQGDVAGAHRFAEESLMMAERNGIRYYIGMAKANLAWVAGRRKHITESERLCREALEDMPPVYPFRWAALWPLIGVAIERQALTLAMDCTRQLLDSTQQRLPNEMTRTLEAAQAAWRDNNEHSATDYLRQSAENAIGLGYL